MELAKDETVTTVAQPQRRIAFRLRQKVEEETAKLEHNDVTESLLNIMIMIILLMIMVIMMKIMAIIMIIMTIILIMVMKTLFMSFL